MSKAMTKSQHKPTSASSCSSPPSPTSTSGTTSSSSLSQDLSQVICAPKSLLVNDLETKLSLDTEEILFDDLVELARQPDLTFQTLATAMSKMTEALGWTWYLSLSTEDDEFLTNIVKYHNTKVLLEVNDVFHFGQGLLRRLLIAATEAADETAVEATIERLRRDCGDSITFNTICDVLYAGPYLLKLGVSHLGYRGMLRQLFKLQPRESELDNSSFREKIGLSARNRDNLRNLLVMSPETHFEKLIKFLTFRTNRCVIQAMEDLLGEDMWTKPQYRSMLDNYKVPERLPPFLTRGGMEYLLRKGALPLTLPTYQSLLAAVTGRWWCEHSQMELDCHHDVIISLMKYVLYARTNKLIVGIPGTSNVYESRPFFTLCVDPKKARHYIDFVEDIAFKEHPQHMKHLIVPMIRMGRLHSLHRLLEARFPDSTQSELRPNGTLITKPSHTVAKKRRNLVVKMIRECAENCIRLEPDLACPALVTYLFYELGVDPREFERVGCFSVFYLNETVPRSVVLWTLYRLHGSEKAGLMWEKAMKKEKAAEERMTLKMKTVKRQRVRSLQEQEKKENQEAPSQSFSEASVGDESDQDSLNTFCTSTSTSTSTSASSSTSSSPSSPSCSSSSSVVEMENMSTFSRRTRSHSQMLAGGQPGEATTTPTSSSSSSSSTSGSGTSTTTSSPNQVYPPIVLGRGREFRFLGNHLDRLAWALETKILSHGNEKDKVNISPLTFDTCRVPDLLEREATEGLKENFLRLGKLLVGVEPSLALPWCSGSPFRMRALLDSKFLFFPPFLELTIPIPFGTQWGNGVKEILDMCLEMWKHYSLRADAFYYNGVAPTKKEEPEVISYVAKMLKVVSGLAEMCFALACLTRNEAVATEMLTYLLEDPLCRLAAEKEHTTPRHMARWKQGIIVQATTMKSLAFLKHVYHEIHSGHDNGEEKMAKGKLQTASSSTSSTSSRGFDMKEWAAILSLMHPKGSRPPERDHIEIGFASGYLVSKELAVRCVHTSLYECLWTGLQFARLDHHAIMPALFWSCIDRQKNPEDRGYRWLDPYASTYGTRKTEDAFVPIAVMRLVEVIAEGDTADKVLALRPELEQFNVQNCTFVTKAEAKLEEDNQDEQEDECLLIEDEENEMTDDDENAYNIFRDDLGDTDYYEDDEDEEVSETSAGDNGEDDDDGGVADYANRRQE